MESRSCTVCKQLKQVTEFTIRKTHRIGKPVSVCNKCKVDYNRQRRLSDPERTRQIERKSKFKRQYGITLDDYYQMLDKQNGGCAICGNKKPSNRTEYFAVDHCHITGKVRGLLCTKCNRGLGLFNDNISNLQTAITYLKEN